MAFDFFDTSFDMGDVLGLGTSLYKTYSAGKRAESQLAPLKAQQEFYSKMIPMLEQHYDPETARRNIRRGVEKQTGLFRDLWEEADRERLARASAAGMIGSTPYLKQQERTLGKRGELLSGIEPSVSQQYYAGPTGLFSGIQNVGSIMSGQPVMTQRYQDLARAADPWSTFLDSYIKNI